MTRIRLIEWLIATVLVVVLHGVALTAWTVFEPKPSGVKLPAKVDQVATVAATDPIALSVTVIGENKPVAASAPAAAAAAPQIASSNEIIVVPTEPSALSTGLGQSTVVAAAPAAPQPPAEPQPSMQQPTAPQASESEPPAPPREIPVMPQPPKMTGLEPPPLTQIPDEVQPDRSPLRDPVPQPKLKPGSEAAPAQAPAAVDNGAANSSTRTASVDPSQATTVNEPSSAAQSAYYRLLLAEIKRAQRYPADAKREGKEGTVYLQIVVQRTGRIRSYDIVKSSGFQELDDEAVQTLVRANEKLPPFPDEIPDSELRFGLPMRFGS